MKRVAILTFVLAVIVSCTSAPDDVADPTWSTCTDPRPEICTREYDPVCAQHSDGSWQTHATGCTACSDAEVIGYRAGACEAAGEPE